MGGGGGVAIIPCVPLGGCKPHYLQNSTFGKLLFVPLYILNGILYSSEAIFITRDSICQYSLVSSFSVF